jgi:choline dehydrogenase
MDEFSHIERSARPFANHLPVRVRFGTGTVAELAGVAAELALTQVVAIVDPAAVDRAAAALRAVSPVALLEIEPGEPTVESVQRAGDAVAAMAARGIVAIGGGSALDTAKGARLAAVTGSSVRELLDGSAPLPAASAIAAVPLIAVPTTAGTGSEVTGGCVMHDERIGRKVGLALPGNRAQAAIVDPELTLGLPPGPTLYGCVDALAQGLGPTVTRTATPIGDGIGLEAVRLAARWLARAVAKPDGIDARAGMSCASLMAGLAMNISECGAEHWLAHPLGTALGIPHGLSVGLVLAESMEIDRQAAPARFERVADAMGEADDGSRDGSRAVRGVRRLLADNGVPTAYSCGLREEHLEVLADEALAFWPPTPPHAWSRDDVLAAYRAALGIGPAR